MYKTKCFMVLLLVVSLMLAGCFGAVDHSLEENEIIELIEGLDFSLGAYYTDQEFLDALAVTLDSYSDLFTFSMTQDFFYEEVILLDVGQVFHQSTYYTKESLLGFDPDNPGDYNYLWDYYHNELNERQIYLLEPFMAVNEGTMIEMGNGFFNYILERMFGENFERSSEELEELEPVINIDGNSATYLVEYTTEWDVPDASDNGAAGLILEFELVKDPDWKISHVGLVLKLDGEGTPIFDFFEIAN